MQFSIVIPAYNYGHLLARAVESACTQPGDDYEVLVIDDGSTDDTPAVLAELSRRYNYLSVVRQANAGPSAARNHGVKLAQGELILFLDADDELLPEALQHFRRVLEETPEATVLVARTISVFPDGREKTAPVPVLDTDREARFLDYLYKRLRLSNGAVMMAKSLLLRFPFSPDLRQTEDIPVFTHCLVAGRCEAVTAPVVRIHKHATSRRHGSDAALAVGMTLVDAVFDPARLPATLLRHRSRYAARRAMSVFRLCHRAGRHTEATAYFKRAWRADWRESLKKPGNFVKFLRSLVLQATNRRSER